MVIAQVGLDAGQQLRRLDLLAQQALTADAQLDAGLLQLVELIAAEPGANVLNLRCDGLARF